MAAETVFIGPVQIGEKTERFGAIGLPRMILDPTTGEASIFRGNVQVSDPAGTEWKVLLSNHPSVFVGLMDDPENNRYFLNGSESSSLHA